MPSATTASPGTGRLEIDKVLCAALGPNDCASDARDTTLAGYDVTFTVVGPNDYGAAISLTLEGAAGSVSVAGLDPGGYTVCEIAVAQKGAQRVPLAVAETEGCQSVAITADQTTGVTFHDARQAGSTPTLTPAVTLSATKALTVTALPAAGAGPLGRMSTGHWLLIIAAGVFLLLGVIGARAARRR